MLIELGDPAKEFDYNTEQGRRERDPIYNSSSFTRFSTDLCSTDLCTIDLCSTDLCTIDLCSTDLCSIDLCSTDQYTSTTDLCSTDLCAFMF